MAGNRFSHLSYPGEAFGGSSSVPRRDSRRPVAAHASAHHAASSAAAAAAASPPKKRRKRDVSAKQLRHAAGAVAHTSLPEVSAGQYSGHDLCQLCWLLSFAERACVHRVLDLFMSLLCAQGCARVCVCFRRVVFCIGHGARSRAMHGTCARARASQCTLPHSHALPHTPFFPLRLAFELRGSTQCCFIAVRMSHTNLWQGYSPLMAARAESDDCLLPSVGHVVAWWSAQPRGVRACG